MERPASTPITLILLDGTCIFCNRLVGFILRRDRAGRFHFAHLQGETARAALGRHGVEPDIDTIYAISDFDTAAERVHEDGAAGRVIWPQLFRLAAILRVIPLPLLDLQYRLFARIRYRLFGQAPSCIAPSSQQQLRFHP